MNNKEIYNDIYKHSSDGWRYSGSNRWARYLIKKVLRKIDRSEVDTILDAGCGEGTKTYFLKTMFNRAHVFGLDFSSYGINIAKERYSDITGLTFEEVDILGMENRRKYDIVCSFDVLEHIEDWQSFASSICEMSNKYILLSFPVGRMREYEKNVGHYRNFKRGEFESFLKGKGFKPVKVLYSGFPFYSPLARDYVNKNFSGGYHRTLTGQFTIKQKIFQYLMYVSFRFFSFDNIGDNFTGLFERIENKEL